MTTLREIALEIAKKELAPYGGSVKIAAISDVPGVPECFIVWTNPLEFKFVIVNTEDGDVKFRNL